MRNKMSLQPSLWRVRLPIRSTKSSACLNLQLGTMGSSSSTAAASPLLPAVPSGDGMPQQQQQQPTPGAHDANHGGSAKMNQLLDANYLGVHTLSVGQVKSTEFHSADQRPRLEQSEAVYQDEGVGE